MYDFIFHVSLEKIKNALAFGKMLFFLLILGSFTIRVQSGELDSLRSVLPELEGRHRLIVLERIATLSSELSGEQRNKTAGDLLDGLKMIAREPKDPEILNMYGNAYCYLNKPDSAVDFFLRAHEMILMLENDTLVADSYFSLGLATFLYALEISK